jgi:hypothetical protein
VTSISDYLNRADQQLDMVRRSLGTARRTWGPARRIEGSEQVSADIAVAQVSAVQALAAAIDRLAAAAESTPRPAPGYQHGIEVRRPDEDAPLTIVASGSLDEVRAAVAQFSREFPRPGPAVAEGQDPDRSIYNGQSVVPGYHPGGALRTGEPAQSEAGSRRCSAATAKGSQCKLPAEPGAAVYAIHAHRIPA